MATRHPKTRAACTLGRERSGESHALRERGKELTCLYSLAQFADGPGRPLARILKAIVNLLPAAWQYPDVTVARIELDGRSYCTPGFQRSLASQSAPILIKGRQRGLLKVGYTRHKPLLDEGPFLADERRLIDAAARQVARLVEQREAAEDKHRLQDQLRHLDRLASVGALSAALAHELNEPLGNILAFAQLAAKERGVPAQVDQDLAKIVKASLHAREIVKKLMLFAHRTPPRKTALDLNAVLEDGLAILEPHCARGGVGVERRFSSRLPQVIADSVQLTQVLVNLVVNAIEAMPRGGRLRVATRPAGRHVVLAVEDTGVGMDPEVQRQIFTPFFTTKRIQEGTGLGLPVVRGIVASHGGTISVRSTVGQGSRFEVRLPRPEAEDKGSQP